MVVYNDQSKVLLSSLRAKQASTKRAVRDLGTATVSKILRPEVIVEVPEEDLTAHGSSFTVVLGMLKGTMKPKKAVSSLTPYRKFCLWDRCAAREWLLTFTRLLCECSKTHIKFYGKYTQNLPFNHSQVHSSETLDTFT